MLRGSILELKNKGVIRCDETIHPLSVVKYEANNLTSSGDMKQLTMNGTLNGTDKNVEMSEESTEGDTRAVTHFTSKLYKAAQTCQALSGRTLRKLPFLAMTEFEHSGVSAQEFLGALNNCITSIQNDLKKI
jgi:hypothetical protein